MLTSRRLFTGIAILAVFAFPSRAQSNAGTVVGLIKDQNGATIQNATVRLANVIAKYAQVAATNDNGAFRLIDVPYNSYVLTVEATGFEPVTREVTVKSNLVVQVDVQLTVSPVRTTVNVREPSGDLLNADKTAASTVIDKDRIRDLTTSQPSRGTEQLVATAPGWTLDANNRLHARGIEYQVQYSIDGVPVTDNLASTFASSPDPRTFRSMEVSTANVPAEYGDKLAGVIAVNTRSGLEMAKSGSISYSGGSFNTHELSFDFGGHTKKFGYLVSAAGTTTDRFLDPPALENFHNHGISGKSFFKFDYAPNQNDLFRFNFFLDGQRFDVPNLPDQQAAGQNQQRRTFDNMQSLSWQHTFSPNTVSYLAFFQRYNSAKLQSNRLATPVFAEQSRHNSTYGALGSLTFVRGHNTIKTGFELTRFPVIESFTFAITDLDALLEKEPDLTAAAQAFTLAHPFLFNDHRTGTEASAYFQDHINATSNLTFDLGVRFDSYHFLVKKSFLSP